MNRCVVVLVGLTLTAVGATAQTPLTRGIPVDYYDMVDPSSAAIPASERAGRSPVPFGKEFQVNSYTTHDQLRPGFGQGPHGNFVVVWHSEGQDGHYFGVFGQRFDSGGSPSGPEFQVNSYTTSLQSYCAAAMDENDEFVVVWTGRADQDGSGHGVFGQRFNSDGSRRENEFQINTFTTGNQEAPEVEFDTDGGFVVVWASRVSITRQDGDSYGIFGQRFMSDGSARGNEFQINSYTTRMQGSQDLKMGLEGDFVVAWTSNGSGGTDSDDSSIQGQRFSSDGSNQGFEFQINSYTTGTQMRPSIGMQVEGGFVVVWQSGSAYVCPAVGQDGSCSGIFAQRYASDGSVLGREFQVNTYNTNNQLRPKISMASTDDFIVVWLSDDGDKYGVVGRGFDSGGSPLGAEFKINSYTTVQNELGVGRNPEGDIIVVWTTDGGQDGDRKGVFGRRVSDRMPFSDGFESGDTTTWSSSVP